MSFNKAIIVGNLGQDIDLRKTKGGDSVCELSVATNEKKRNENGDLVIDTEWHSVQVFGRTADNCAQYLRKGSKVLVEGKIRTSSWVNKEGVERNKKQIIAYSVEFMDPKGGRTEDSSERPVHNKVQDFGSNRTIDSIPF